VIKRLRSAILVIGSLVCVGFFLYTWIEESLGLAITIFIIAGVIVFSLRYAGKREGVRATDILSINQKGVDFITGRRKR